jgi:hypothetical protein
VRIVTVAQRAKVASMIIVKIAHEGMMPPRRRTSARVPTNSRDSSAAVAGKVSPREAGRCAASRESVQ